MNPIESDGYHAYFQGKEKDDCPYEPGAEPYDAWHRGFDKAASRDEDQ
jgi:ribosome modulation factor